LPKTEGTPTLGCDHLARAPYGFLVEDPDFVLFGASPETAVKVEQGVVEISPIAGTRGRGARNGRLDPDLDARIEAELRLDEKETAEHLMLVDLARNDVSRVAVEGRTQVERLMAVARFSQVMHLVSEVRAPLRPELDALHALRAALNPGTLVGAPKVRAAQILAELEAGPRGAYGGALVLLRSERELDSAIVIRSALVRDGVATVRAGAGIVADSRPRDEADETRRKAAAVLEALGATREATS
jgi:anthranilate synthase component 1